MRWQRLFADLEVDALGLDMLERDAEIMDRTRAELASIRLADRFRAAIGVTVSVRVEGADGLRGQVRQVAACWLLLATSEQVEWLVAWSALLGVTGLPAQASPSRGSQIAERMGWPATWRALARNRDEVHVVRRDGSVVTGVPERAGADFVEIRHLGPDADVRSRRSAGRELLPYEAVAALRCQRDTG